jgi:hypothetical protein
MLARMNLQYTVGMALTQEAYQADPMVQLYEKYAQQFGIEDVLSALSAFYNYTLDSSLDGLEAEKGIRTTAIASKPKEIIEMSLPK